MSRRTHKTKLNSKMFREAMEIHKRKHGMYKDDEVDRELRKVLPEQVELETIRTWRYKKNPAIGIANLKAIKEFLGVDCALYGFEEVKDNMLLENKLPVIQAQLAIEMYRFFYEFVREVEFGDDMLSIECSAYDLEREFESRMPFLADSLKHRFERAVEEIVYPLSEWDRYEDEHAKYMDICIKEGIDRDNEYLVLHAQSRLYKDYMLKLQELAEDIRMYLSKL